MQSVQAGQVEQRFAASHGGIFGRAEQYEGGFAMVLLEHQGAPLAVGLEAWGDVCDWRGSDVE